MKGAALRPDFFGNLPSLVVKDQANKNQVTEDEQHLYSLSQHRGWKIIEESAEALMRDFDEMNQKAILSGATKEQLGENVIVISLAKGVIQRLLDKVNDAKEAVERPDGTTR